MNEIVRPPSDIEPALTKARPAHPYARWAWFALPLAAFLLAVAWLVGSDWLKAFEGGAPPVEKLTFERIILDGDGIHAKVRASGSAPVTIAQVQVDEAYWQYWQHPTGALDSLSSAWLHIPYPWVLGEKHVIKVLSKNGVPFEKEIEVAVPTPKPQPGQLLPQALLGTFVGIVPVVIGMLFYPAMRTMGRSGLNFVLALTIGLLAFLLIDTLKEALEFANKAAAPFQGIQMVLLTATTSFLILLVVGRRSGTPSGLALATFIALGIGLHNFGEGLAIGAAFAAGVAGLGVFLVLGFTLHNVSEGIGIVAPLVEERPSLPSALALAIGAGAILQVVIEVGAYMARQSGHQGMRWLSPSTLGGFVLGIGVMYVTGMLVKV